jgi:MFS family permease
VLDYQQNLTKRFYAVLSMPATAFGLALSVQLSALSWILVTKYGLDIHDIGLVWAAGPLAGIFGQIIIGTLSDRVWFWHGRRRGFIMIGGMVAALSLLALPQIGVISSSLGFEGLVGVALVVALTLDFAVNVGFNPARSIIADVTPEGDERTRGYTWMQTMSGSVSSFAGYAVGAIFGNMVLIYVGAALVLAMTLLPPLLVEEPRELVPADEVEQEKTSLKEILLSIQPLWGFLVYDTYAMTLRLAGVEVEHYYAEIICGIATLFLCGRALLRKTPAAGATAEHHGEFQKVLAAHSFSWIGIHTTFVYMIVYIQQYFPDLSDFDSGRSVSLTFMVLNIVGALVPLFLLQPVSVKLGRTITHALALAIMAAAYVVMFGFVDSLVLVYVMIGIVGIGWGSIVSLPFAIMTQKVESTRMGLYMGLFNLSVVLPQLTVSLGVAYLVSRAPDKAIIFLISAITIALSALAWTRVSENDESQAPSSDQAAPKAGGHH